jgi:hypothetical protein
MKMFKSLALVLMFCFFALPAFASGVLVDAKGSVTITMPGGKSAAAKTGAELPDGAKISVGKGSLASVMMMDGSIEEIGANQNFTVGGKEKVQGKKTVIDGIALAMNEVSSAGSQPTVHGMIKMGRMGPGEPKPTVSVGAGLFGPEAIFPVETTIYESAEITFTWKYGAKFNFKDPVLVINDIGQKQIGSKKISPQNGRLSVNSADLNLSAGNRYSWYFASDEKGKIQGKSRRFNFRIISPAEKQKLDADIAKIKAFNMSDDGKKFLTAQLYYRQQMIDAMVKELAPVWKNNQSDSVKKLLFYGYSRMGQPEEAKKYQ